MAAVHAAIGTVYSTTIPINIGKFSYTATLRKHGKSVFFIWRSQENHTNSNIATNNWVQIGMIPADYRPSESFFFPSSNGINAVLDSEINSNGAVRIYSTSVDLGYELGMSLTWIQA